MGAEETAERVAAWAGFVAEFQESVRMGGPQLVEKFEDVVVGTADDAVAADLGGVGGGDGDGDGIVVDIQADEECGGAGLRTTRRNVSQGGGGWRGLGDGRGLGGRGRAGGCGRGLRGLWLRLDRGGFFE